MKNDTQTNSKGKEIQRLRDMKVGVRDLIMLSPADICIEPGHNPRDYELKENREHLDELKASIKENGVLNPVLVRWEPSTKEAILVDGECRLRACLELIAEGVEIVSVPSVQVSAGNEADRLLKAITANTGKPLSQWEIGTAFRRFVAFGWTEEMIAQKTGYKVRWIKEAIELADAPEEVKYLLSEQAVTPSLALSTIRKSGAAAVLELKAKVEEAKSEGRQVAKREKKPKKEKIRTEAELLKLARKVLKGVSAEDLEDEGFEFVEVYRKALKDLAQYVAELDR